MSETEKPTEELQAATETRHSDLFIGLKSKFGSSILQTETQYDFEIIEFERSILLDLMVELKKNYGFSFLTTMCGLHYPDEKGRELGLMYQLHNLPENKRIRLKTFFPIDEPKIKSLSTLFPTSGWMERQEYDFFGIIFEGHPDLRRILNVDDMEYFPMRKEFPLEDASRHDKNDSMFGRD